MNNDRRASLETIKTLLSELQSQTVIVTVDEAVDRIKRLIDRIERLEAMCKPAIEGS